jgi:alpha-galactosidase
MVSLRLAWIGFVSLGLLACSEPEHRYPKFTPSTVSSNDVVGGKPIDKAVDKPDPEIVMSDTESDTESDTDKEQGTPAETVKVKGGPVETVWLDQLPLEGFMQQDFGSPQVNHNVDGGAFSLRMDQLPGVTATRGVGTHSNSYYILNLNGDASRFQAVVGLDGNVGSVRFYVIGDGKTLYTSPVMGKDSYAAAVDVDLTDVKQMVLLVDEAEGGIVGDHADWINASITYSGTAPTPPKPLANPPQMGILTPPVAAAPVLTFPKVFGVRPGSPILFTLTATGERPMTFSATGLPAGAVFDAAKGRISGSVATAGTYDITVKATSAKGTSTRNLKMKVGSTIALTPPMGWNPFNAFGVACVESQVRQGVDALVTTGLFDQGYVMVGIDDGWQGTRSGPRLALQPDPARYPDMKGLIKTVHDKGMRFGIYSSPWKFSFANRPGSSADNADGTSVFDPDPNKVGNNRVFGAVSFVAADAAEWAEWGIDMLKFDWNPNDGPSTQPMSNALAAAPRDVTLSIANGAAIWQAHAIMPLSQMVRTGFDVHDRWSDVKDAFRAAAWKEYQKPGHWTDLDMLPFGVLGAGFNKPNHSTQLTQNEQYTVMSLWSLAASPLIIGSDLTKMDAFTLSLLTNREVLDMAQDPLGKMATRIAVAPEQKSLQQERWFRQLEDGSVVVGLFNLSDLGEQYISFKWSDLQLKGKQMVRDIWTQKDLGVMSDSVRLKVPVHGVALVKLTPVP